jgi:hypothetical protein
VSIEEEGSAGGEVLASKAPGPEETVLTKELIEILIRPLPELTPKQQKIYVRRFLQNARIVDLEDETGNSANALRKGAFDLRRHLVKVYESEGVTRAEVDDWLNYLDRGDHD